ncbi:hypothetical protein QL285_045867 [Trifolium repens]|nr:hypothetical protein QL285_045867 [Trifolium repens]
MFSINPSMYVGLRNPKNLVLITENAKQLYNHAGLRPGALTRARGRAMAPTPRPLRPGALTRARPTCCLLSAAC